jgi:aminopeptidase N/glutamyl aminopeptidase
MGSYYGMMQGRLPYLLQFDLQVVGNVFPVMTKDSLLTSHSISAPIVHPDEITQYFDSISYDKV